MTPVASSIGVSPPRLGDRFFGDAIKIQGLVVQAMRKAKLVLVHDASIRNAARLD